MPLTPNIKAVIPRIDRWIEANEQTALAMEAIAAITPELIILLDTATRSLVLIERSLHMFTAQLERYMPQLPK